MLPSGGFRLRALPVLALMAIAVGLPTEAGAVDLVAGGYMERPGGVAEGGRAEFGVRPIDERSAGREMTMAFTPRGGVSLHVDGFEDVAGDAPRLRLSIAGGDSSGSRYDTMRFGGLDASGDLGPDAPQAGGLAVGGAIEWYDWTLGGSVARTRMLGPQTDLVGASVGWGPITARLAYGENTSSSVDDQELWMFSTDLATWSWLTLEGDLGVATDQQSQEEVTVGRFGVRLNF